MSNEKEVVLGVFPTKQEAVAVATLAAEGLGPLTKEEILRLKAGLPRFEPAPELPTPVEEPALADEPVPVVEAEPVESNYENDFKVLLADENAEEDEK